VYIPVSKIRFTDQKKKRSKIRIIQSDEILDVVWKLRDGDGVMISNLSKSSQVTRTTAEVDGDSLTPQTPSSTNSTHAKTVMMLFKN
jgi:hypothetical protein